MNARNCAVSAVGMAFCLATAVFAQAPGEAPQALPLPRVQVTVTAASSGITVSQGNGRRSIKLQEGDEKIELQERDGGKEIRLRHERKVNGEQKQDEYQAPDLETLQKQHPQAAELYRRAVERANALQVRPLLQVPAIGAEGRVLAPFSLGQSHQPPPGQGQRTIQATVKGHKVKISDRYGAHIEMAITRKVDGREQTEEHTAPDLATLKKQAPEAAALYQRLTGMN